MISVVGVGELPQGRLHQHDPTSLQTALSRAALADAGMAANEVDALITVAPHVDRHLVHALSMAERLRIRPSIALTVEAGGTAPAMMLEVARGLIEGGRAKTVLILTADMPLTRIGRGSYGDLLTAHGPIDARYERPFGATTPSLFALVASAYASQHGLEADHLAAVALQDRRMANMHPHAHMRNPLDREAYDAAPMIADPLRLFDCAPVSDGGGALILTSTERAAPQSRPSVELLGTGFITNHMHLSAARSLTTFSAGEALSAALTQAGVSRTDIDLALVYDCFTIAMLVNVEDLGFAQPGGAGEAFAAGAFGMDGRLPVNTHGGLLSHGHAARAGGIGNLIEAVVQLRGEAGERQVSGAEVAMVHGMAGVFAAHGVALLRRLDA